MSDYEKYEQDCKQIRAENQKLLDDFETWLRNKNLVDDTIRTHTSNIDFYINQFLLYREAKEAKEGHTEVSWFLGDWFIRKAMWASVSSIKENAASLKKFYTFMLEKGCISEDDLIDLKETIKDEMPDWLEELRRFDNLSIEDFGDS